MFKTIILMFWCRVVLGARDAARGQILFEEKFDVTLNTKRWNLLEDSVPVTEDIVQQYTRSAIGVKADGLTVTADRSGDKSFTSGKMNTKGKFAFKYGEVEIRAKFPSSGKGIWSALRLQPECDGPQDCALWPPRVTIAEYRFNVTGEVKFAVVYKDLTVKIASSSTPTVPQKNNRYTNDYQIYGVKWTATRLEWLLNRQSVYVVENPLAVPSAEMYLEFSMRIGGQFAGGLPDEETKFPADFTIREVTVRSLTRMDSSASDVNGNVSASPSANTTGKPSSSVLSFLAPLLGTLLPLLLIAAVVGLVLRRKRNRLTNTPKMHLTPRASSVCVNAMSETGSDWKVADYMKGQQAVLQYVSLLEVPLASLEISESVLGSGKYGIVRKGVAKRLRGIDRPVTLAIKSARNPMDEQQRWDLLEEMKIMSKAGRHLNILNLLGTVIKGETLLLTELCPLGCLMNYLRNHRGLLFKNNVDPDGKITQNSVDPRRDSKESPCASESVYEETICTRDLINFAFQTARGMEYLAYRNIIHRDLAARNVLVAADRIVKISDFGMARQEGEYVLANKQVAMPVRWMAPEAITKRVFSQKTDVWSFGILLWEIFTLAETPYHNSGVSLYITDFVIALSQGYRMPRPPNCPSAVFQIMQNCWMDTWERRPEFKQITAELRSLLGFDTDETYLALDIPYNSFNDAHQSILDEVAEEYPTEESYSQSALVFVAEGHLREVGLNCQGDILESI